ncbi:MAG: polymerase sigma-70 factor, subfamily [Actinomycetota bacterium]|nr:polymerase sigma-70 factor, subfamily [Actinomycetota bacterium]
MRGSEGVAAAARHSGGMEPLLPLPVPAWVFRVALGMGLLRASAMPQVTGEVDALVLARARRGDHRAFAQIVDHYDHRLRGLAFRLLGDRDRMDDILQEAYVNAFRSMPRFKGDSALGTWLYRIVYNACIDDHRSRKATVPLDDHFEVADTRPDPADIAVRRGDLAAALDTLPPDQKAAVLLVDAYGLDYAEAASALGVATGTIGSRLNRARATLRTVLGPPR